MSRTPDPHWDALVAALNMGDMVLNSAERGRLNKAIKLIRESGGTPEDITERARLYRRLWGQRVPLTALALANNWNQIMQVARENGLVKRPTPAGVTSQPVVEVKKPLSQEQIEKNKRELANVKAWLESRRKPPVNEDGS